MVHKLSDVQAGIKVIRGVKEVYNIHLGSLSRELAPGSLRRFYLQGLSSGGVLASCSIEHVRVFLPYLWDPHQVLSMAAAQARFLCEQNLPKQVRVRVRGLEWDTQPAARQALLLVQTFFERQDFQDLYERCLEDGAVRFDVPCQVIDQHGLLQGDLTVALELETTKRVRLEGGVKPKSAGKSAGRSAGKKQNQSETAQEGGALGGS